MPISTRDLVILMFIVGTGIIIEIRIQNITELQQQSLSHQEIQRLIDDKTSYLLTKYDNLRLKYSELEKLHKDMKAEIGKDGAIYTRWGRKQCAGNMTELVYAGFGGGSWYDHTGAASNHLCLPTDPLWGIYNDNIGNYRGYVHGMEYEHLEFPTTLHDENVPCAVCRAKASTVLMIPARNKCYPGWNMEYHGNLVSGWWGHKASTQYICLDASPEVLQAGNKNENGALLYSVEGICGSLPCPPYVKHRELTCVVCSK